MCPSILSSLPLLQWPKIDEEVNAEQWSVRRPLISFVYSRYLTYYFTLASSKAHPAFLKVYAFNFTSPFLLITQWYWRNNAPGLFFWTGMPPVRSMWDISFSSNTVLRVFLYLGGHFFHVWLFAPSSKIILIICRLSFNHLRFSSRYAADYCLIVSELQRLAQVGVVRSEPQARRRTTHLTKIMHSESF